MAESCQFDDKFESEDIDVDREEDLSRYYFFRGFGYKDNVLLLLKNNDVEISLSTLKRRIKGYGLSRQRPEHNVNEVKASIQTIINGHGSLKGSRSL